MMGVSSLSTKEMGVVTKLSSAHFLYQVTLSDDVRVYMRVLDINYERQNTYVVIVDSGKFVRLWRNARFDAHREIANGGPELWKSDYKFKDAQKGFAKGIVNPVPLADVNCYREKRKTFFGSSKYQWCVSFTNGITRTIFLLAYGATSFPVVCRGEDDAFNLHKNAGVDEFSPKSIEQLIPGEYSCVTYLNNNGFINATDYTVDCFKLIREKWKDHHWWDADLSHSKSQCPFE